MRVALFAAGAIALGAIGTHVRADVSAAPRAHTSAAEDIDEDRDSPITDPALEAALRNIGRSFDGLMRVGVFRASDFRWIEGASLIDGVGTMLVQGRLILIRPSALTPGTGFFVLEDGVERELSPVALASPDPFAWLPRPVLETPKPRPPRAPDPAGAARRDLRVDNRATIPAPGAAGSLFAAAVALSTRRRRA